MALLRRNHSSYSPRHQADGSGSCNSSTRASGKRAMQTQVHALVTTMNRGWETKRSACCVKYRNIRYLFRGSASKIVIGARLAVKLRRAFEIAMPASQSDESQLRI